MPAEPRTPHADKPPRRDVDDFTRSVHASYLNRWLRHDPAGPDQAAEQAPGERKRKKRTSAA